MSPTCAISECTRNRKKDKTADNFKKVQYHRFPKDEKLCEQWAYLCNRGDKGFNPANARICSLHFHPEDDYERPYRYMLELKPVLKKNAIPSLNLEGEDPLGPSTSNHNKKIRKKPRQVKDFLFTTAPADPVIDFPDENVEQNIIKQQAWEGASMSYAEDPMFGDDQLVLKDEPLPEMEDEPSSHHQLQEIAMVLLKQHGDVQPLSGLTNDVDPLMDTSGVMTSQNSQRPSPSVKVKLQSCTTIPTKTQLFVPIPRIPIIPNITRNKNKYVPIESTSVKRPEYIPKKTPAKVLVQTVDQNVSVNLKKSENNTGNCTVNNLQTKTILIPIKLDTSKQNSSKVQAQPCVNKITRKSSSSIKNDSTTKSKTISHENSGTLSTNPQIQPFHVPSQTLPLNTNDKPFYLISDTMQLLGIIRQSNLINVLPYLETVLIPKQSQNVNNITANESGENSNSSTYEIEMSENNEQIADDFFENSEPEENEKELNSKTTSYPCKKCKETFTDIKDYYHHYAKKHKQRRLKKPKANAKMKKTRKTTYDNKFQCKICSKFLSSSTNLKIHESKHDPNIEKPFHCKKCNRRYWSNRNLKLHCCRPIVEKQKEFKCDKCEKILTNRRSLNYHLKNHFRIVRFFCDKCSKGYYIKAQLLRHMEAHLNIAGKICDICGKVLSGKGSLRTHLKTHNKERPFICHLCGYSYPNKPILDKHLYLHKGLRNFQCEFCSKALTTKVAIRDHIMKHLNIKPFHCKGCNVSYTSVSALSYHTKTVHHGLHRSNLRRKEPVKQLASRKIVNKDLINSDVPIEKS